MSKEVETATTRSGFGEQGWLLVLGRSDDKPNDGDTENMDLESKTKEANKIAYKNRPKKLFFIRTWGFISYKEFLGRVQESTRLGVDQIIYEKNDQSRIIISNDESLNYVKKLEYERMKKEPGFDATIITLTIKPTWFGYNRLIPSDDAVAALFILLIALIEMFGIIRIIFQA